MFGISISVKTMATEIGEQLPMEGLISLDTNQAATGDVTTLRSRVLKKVTNPLNKGYGYVTKTTGSEEIR